MPLKVQGKLLKAIEDSRVRPIGGKEEYMFDIRIIASCNRSLSEIMNSSHLRQDFYFRLAVLQLELPPLCQRDRDVLLIAQYYTDEAESYLMSYSFKGNIRELKNLIERLYFDDSTEEMISLKTVKQKLQEQRENEYKLSDADYEDFINSGRSLTEYMAEAENRMIEEAIAASGGNMVRAAEMLKVSPKTLKNRQR